jgi:GlpG protein
MPDNWDFTTPRLKQSEPQFPILTGLLCAVAVLVTLANTTAGNETGTFWSALGSFAQPYAVDIWSGKVWQLFTAIFLHSGWMHLLFDVYWLYILGSMIEKEIGQIKLLAFVVVSALVTGGCQMAWAGEPGIGLSGVVYAMVGLMWIGRMRYETWGNIMTRQTIQLMVGWALLCIVTTYFHIMAIANSAHVSGLIFGLSLSWIWLAPRKRWIWAVPLAATLIIAGMGVWWMPWSSDWKDVHSIETVPVQGSNSHAK